MRTVLLTGLLLVSAGGPALADNLTDRFSQDFGASAPAASGAAPAAAGAAPPAAVSPAPAAAGALAPAVPALVAPKPKRRPLRDATRSAGDADVSAFASQPASRPGNPPSAPAVKAIKSVAPIAGSDYQVGISWNVVDPSWDGMFVTNNSGGSLSLLGLELNNRSQCQLKPYSLDKIKVFGLQQAVKAWGNTAAINLIGLPKTGSGSVLAPELPRNMQDLGLAPEEATLKAGDRIPIVNATKCSPVVEARVATDGGAVSIKFKRPYSGH